MQFVIDRFEDNDIAVLEASDGESIYIPRGHLPEEAHEGDVVLLLPEALWEADVRYEIDMDATIERQERARALRVALPKAEEGDLEL